MGSPSVHRPRKRPSGGDDLVVRMPTFSDDEMEGVRPRTTTARSFTFDRKGRRVDDPERERERSKAKRATKPAKEPVTEKLASKDDRQWELDQDAVWESEERALRTPAGKENTRSKYFAPLPPSPLPPSPSPSPSPSPRAGGALVAASPSTTTPARVLVESSSAAASPRTPIRTKRARTVLSPTTAAPANAPLPLDVDIDVIDLTSSSPRDGRETPAVAQRRAPVRAAAVPAPPPVAAATSAAPLPLRFPPRVAAWTASGSILDYLGVVDEQGRPRRGVVAGDKVRRR